MKLIILCFLCSACIMEAQNREDVDSELIKTFDEAETACNLKSRRKCYELTQLANNLTMSKGLHQKVIAKCKSSKDRNCSFAAMEFLKNNDMVSAILYSEIGCNNGDAYSCNLLGQIHYKGKKDIKVAKEKFRFACGKNIALSCYFLGDILGLEHKTMEELENYKKSCDLGYPPACYDAACVYSKNFKNKEKSLYYLKLSLEYGFNELDFIKSDKDLDYVRDSKEFAEIIGKFKL